MQGRLMRFVALVALGALLALSLTAAVQAQGDGVLEGEVVNGTPDGQEVGAGLPVTLHIFLGDVEADTAETTTDEDGRFRFEGLDTDPSLEYWLEAVYQDVPYSSDGAAQFAEGETTVAATVTVFETTTDDSGVQLDSVHLIVESFGEVLRVNEIHLFGNDGDRAYVGQAQGGEPLTVFIPLPENAVGLAFGQDASPERFVEVEGGLYDTEPVVPGAETSLVFFSYHVMAGTDAILLPRQFAYPVAILNVLAAQPGLTLQSDQLTSMGQKAFQGREYLFYAARDLPANATVDLALTSTGETEGGAAMPGGSPAAGAPAAGTSTDGNQGLLRWFGFGLAFLAIAVAIVYPFVTRRPARAPAPSLRVDLQARRLLADLADLEDAYEAGRVESATYQQRRAELYEALKSS